MKNAKLAAAVGVGYLLGRLRKARWALALAGMAAGKKLGASPGAAVAQLLESSPQLRQVVGDVRGELASAGKKAAVAAASRRVGALTDQLEQRTEALREANGQREDDEPPDEEEPQEEETKASAKTRRTRSGSSSRKTSSAGGSSRTRTATKRPGTGTSTRKSTAKAPAKAPAKKAAPRTAAARKSTASSAAKKTSAPARRTTGSRTSARKSG